MTSTVAWVLAEDGEPPQPPPAGSKLARLLLGIADQDADGAVFSLVKHAELFAACSVVEALGGPPAEVVLRLVGRIAREPAADPTQLAARLDDALRTAVWA